MNRFASQQSAASRASRVGRPQWLGSTLNLRFLKLVNQNATSMSHSVKLNTAAWYRSCSQRRTPISASAEEPANAEYPLAAHCRQLGLGQTAEAAASSAAGLHH